MGVMVQNKVACFYGPQCIATMASTICAIWSQSEE